MKRLLLAAALAMWSLVMPAILPAQSKTQLTQRVYDSVVLLYQQDESGGMQMLCSATNYKQVDKTTYRYVSAAHCVQGKTEAEQKSAKYFVTMDTNGSKTFVPAKLVEAGDMAVGDDFSIFEVKSDAQLAVVPLGDDTKMHIGDDVMSVAAPLGLGKQFFEGFVSEMKIDRPPLDAGVVKWHDTMLIEIGGGPGSSGSSIVSDDQQAIVGFLVGGTPANIGMIVIPVSQFKVFEAKVDSGKYKKGPQPQQPVPDFE